MPRHPNKIDSTVRRGRVVFFNDLKGYGFIRPIERMNGQGDQELSIDKRPGDVFVHYSGIAGNGHRTLQRDQWVEYQLVEQNPNKPNGKPMAHNVNIVLPGETA